MNRSSWCAVLCAAMLLGAATGAAPPPAGAPARVKSVTLRVRHRVFPGFKEDHRIALKKDFAIGDTDYTARVVEYVPDFAMGMESKKVFSRSNEPNNPAFRIIVRMKGQPQDTTWALLNMPPHYTRKSLLAFKVMRIDFMDHPAIVNPDTAETAPKPVEKAGDGRS
jgi:hypothetical protein